MGDPWTHGADAFPCPLCRTGNFGVVGENTNDPVACPVFVGVNITDRIQNVQKHA